MGWKRNGKTLRDSGVKMIGRIWAKKRREMYVSDLCAVELAARGFPIANGQFVAWCEWRARCVACWHIRSDL